MNNEEQTNVLNDLVKETLNKVNNKKSINEQEKLNRELEQKELKIIYNDLFNSKNGIKILKDLINKSGYFFTMINLSKDNQNRVDPLQLAYLDGRKSLFCEIANLLSSELLIKAKDYGTNTNQ